MADGVVEAIREVIAREGKVSFAKYMELALYHEAGYYGQSVKIGGSGADFYTASQFPLFGFTLGHYILQKWLSDNKPARLQIVELGAGQGELAEHICAYLARSLPDSITIEYVIDETSDYLKGVQGHRLFQSQSPNVHVRWGQPDPHLDSVLIANEVLDALPIERLKRSSKGWLQAFVRVDEVGTCTLYWEPALEPLTNLANQWLPIPVGTEAEICPQLPDFFARCRGFARNMTGLFFDYGIHSSELRAGIRPQGTLRAFFRHQVVDVLTTPGGSDITADVLWDHATSCAIDLGWAGSRVIPQGSFLMEVGIADVLRQAWDGDGKLGQTMEAATRQFKQLVLPGGMGERFSVLECR